MWLKLPAHSALGAVFYMLLCYTLNDINKLSVQLFWTFGWAILQWRCDLAREQHSPSLHL